ncbi:coiled-coil domain-containing glutamate-rich protein 1 [Canis lupus dingo]|uniref:coiled-coil domain-containing glutamate-rich protein 1 n=1 Tax=Canis lupus dingo TaxID=286419 RepID=UPI0020C59A65|nr:coiled-coil domain-containing glutamate-rich protein 1 [Canis lupus dingo]
MTQTLYTREEPRNLGGGWAPPAPLRTWSTCHRRRRGAPIYKRRRRYGPKSEYEPPWKQPKQQHGPGPWFQPPRRPYWAVSPNGGRRGGPWRPPPGGFWRRPGRVQVIRVYGLHPVCLCCCSCWRGPWKRGWARPPGRRKRWGRRGRGPRRPPRRPSPPRPPAALSTLLRPVNLYGWRAPGMRAPRNTTQFIMNQIYEDMRQEELERQQEALRRQQAAPGGSSQSDEAPRGEEGEGEEEDREEEEEEEDAGPWGAPYGGVQDPSLVFSPDPDRGLGSPAAPLGQEEEGEEGEEGEECECECDNEECDGKEESQEEEEEEEASDDEEEEVEEGEEDQGEEGEEDQEEEEEDQEEEEETEEEAVEEEEPREEENHLPLQMPLSFLVGPEEERENFLNCAYLSPKQIIPRVAQEALLVVETLTVSRKRIEDGMELM